MQTIAEKVDLNGTVADCDHTCAVTTIRRATFADLPRIVAMGERFLREVYAGRLTHPPDPERLRATAMWLLEDCDRAVFVAELDDKVIGMLGLFLHPHPFTGEQAASEMFWWVEPEHRGSGLKLLRAATAWAREAGATLLQMVAPGADVARAYEAMGFTKVETSYARRL